MGKIIVIALLVLWVVGMVSGMGGVVHLLPLIAIGFGAFRIVQASKARAAASESMKQANRAAQNDLLRRALQSRPTARHEDD